MKVLKRIIKGILIKEESDGTKQLEVTVNSSATTNTKTTIEAAQTSDRTLTLPDATDTLLGRDTTDTLTNKSIDADQNTITNIENADIKAGAAIDATKIHDGSVDNTEFGYLSGVTSDIQSQLDDKANITLSNLSSSTAINESLVPDLDSTIQIGSSSKRFLAVNSTTVSTPTNYIRDNSWAIYGSLKQSDTTPSSESLGVALRTEGANETNLGIFTQNNSANNSTPTGNVLIETGNKTDGTGNSGDISIITGTSVGGSRGNINLDAATVNVSQDLVVTGDLTINGTTTTINTANLEVEDANILINKNGNDASAEGAGLSIERTGTNGSLVYEDALASKFKIGALGSEVEVADVSSAQVFSNKSFSNELTFDQIATPTTPASGKLKVYAKNNDKLYKLNSSGEEVEIGTGAGGSGGKTYIENADFETNIDGVTTYDDTGAYVDGTGGSPATITVSRNTTTPLSGTADLQIAKAATDGSGEGVTITSTAIDRSDRGRNLFVTFEWDGTDANYTDGDLELKAYSTGTDATILPVVPVAGLNEDGTLPKLKTKIVAYIPTNSDTDSTVRVSLHLASDSATASAWNCYLDDIKLSPDSVVPGAIITPWQSYTPTFSAGFGTTSLIFAEWRRVGEEMEVRGQFTTGTVTAGAPTVSIPSGYAGVTLTAEYNNAGDWRQAGSSTDNFTSGSMGYNSNATFLTFYDDYTTTASSGSPSSAANTSVIFRSSSTVFFNATIKIANWEASAALSTTEVGLQTVQVIAYHAGGTSIANNTETDLPFEVEVKDTHSAYNTTTGIFTAPRTGAYDFQMQVMYTGLTVSTGSIQTILTDESNNYLAFRRLGIAGSTIHTGSLSTSLYLTKGDQVKTRTKHDNGAARSTVSATTSNLLTITSRPDLTHFSVYGQTEVQESTSTAVSYTITAGQFGDLTSIQLTPGEWDIYLHAQFISSGTTSTTNVFLGVSTTSGNSSTGLVTGDTQVYKQKTTTADSSDILTLHKLGVVVTTPTTYYLKAAAVTSITNLQVAYKISARKVR